MAISVFPAPVAPSSSNAFAATIPALATTYEHIANFPAGIYTISVSPTSTNAKVTFVSNSAMLTSVSTTAGTVAAQLNTPATRVYITTRTGGSAGAVVTVAKTADALTPDDIGNGTLDTINTTGNYNQTGVLGVLVLGGGEGGRYGSFTGGAGGAGGRAGFINGDVVVTNTSTLVTIGAGGIGQTSTTINSFTPTNSSFGNLVTATSANNTDFPNGNGGAGSVSSNLPGNASGVFVSWNGNSTTGGGGGGNGPGHAEAAAGGGSGIGTGGQGGGLSNVGNGSGKASGGGGGKGANTGGAPARVGGNGADGVVYILRGF
jgi:hypothetical protein